ncbi:hypothetical protein L1049_026280 [Liquidambar formosana]|uniref:Major facilitator superfamily (MFS) profile domain-containing protein n=1 Tax=Liquidambar formosana TaxID=63359 RepID=A0AAP0NDD4_LIQFO
MRKELVISLHRLSFKRCIGLTLMAVLVVYGCSGILLTLEFNCAIGGSSPDSIHVMITSSNNIMWVCTAVYKSLNPRISECLWDSLKEFVNSHNLPSLITRDLTILPQLLIREDRIMGLTIERRISWRKSGGVLSMDNFLVKLSPTAFTEKRIAKQNDFCSYINQWLILFISSLHISATVSLFLALFLSNRWGRKPVLIIGSFLLCVGVGLTTCFHNAPIGTTGRIILGAGLGFILQVIPMILSETAPKETQGKLDKLFQLQIYIGGVLAYMANYIASYYHVWGWMLSFGIVGVPVTVLLLSSLAVSETPTCLIQHGKPTEAEDTLRRIRGTDVEVEFSDLSKAIESSQVENPVREILKLPSRPALVITTMAQVLQPLLGMNLFLNFGPLLFESLNFKSHVAFLVPVIISCFGMPFMFISPFILKLIGRRMLYLIACAALFFSQIVTWEILSSDLNPYHHLKDYVAYVMMSMVVVSAVGNAILTGPDGWLSNTFPKKTKVVGSVLVVGLSLIMNVVTAQGSLHLYCSLNVWIFLFSAACIFVTACFIYFLVPETTGVKEHALVRKVWKRHWFWKRYMLDGEDLYS